MDLIGKKRVGTSPNKKKTEKNDAEEKCLVTECGEKGEGNQ